MTFQVNKDDGLFYRQTLFDQAKRVVLKVGSAVLTNDNGLDLDIIANIARQVSFLHATGREVILVSSGAVAAGRKRLGIVKTPHEELKVKQALAATGQGLLMQAYEQAFAEFDQSVAQVLLTHADLSNRGRYLNVRNTILTLFEFGVVPIINENDTVSAEELRFSDNDTLGALMTNMIGADMFIILTDVDSLYTGNPSVDSEARPIYTIASITKDIEKMAGNSTSSLGTGGMMAKIRAAKMVAACGGCSFIGPGKHPEILKTLFSGELVGTFFLPGQGKINRRKHWIAYVLKPQGFVVVDNGARRALVEQGKSLLPSGITEIRGSFPVGAPVHCLDGEGTVIAAGLSNYSSADLERIKGLKSREIFDILGRKEHDEVIHRDNLVLMANEGLAARTALQDEPIGS
nr:glutamate 5-kinase [uncultured Desulfobulbus sp.]